MKHRHLLPEEFDLLLDDEVGFGVAPLREHIQECAPCRARYDEAKAVATELEELPRLAPSFAFADRIMAEVPVFVPWHVALRDSLARWIPQSRPARIAVVGLMATGAGAVTGLAVWMASRGDVVSLATELAGTHVRSAATAVVSQGMAAVFGPSVMDSLQRGGLEGLAAVGGGFLVAAAVSGLGLRAIASAARRRG